MKNKIKQALRHKLKIKIKIIKEDDKTIFIFNFALEVLIIAFSGLTYWEFFK